MRLALAQCWTLERLLWLAKKQDTIKARKKYFNIINKNKKNTNTISVIKLPGDFINPESITGSTYSNRQRAGDNNKAYHQRSMSEQASSYPSSQGSVKQLLAKGYRHVRAATSNPVPTVRPPGNHDSTTHLNNPNNPNLNNLNHQCHLNSMGVAREVSPELIGCYSDFGQVSDRAIRLIAAFAGYRAANWKPYIREDSLSVSL